MTALRAEEKPPYPKTPMLLPSFLYYLPSYPKHVLLPARYNPGPSRVVGEKERGPEW